MEKSEITFSFGTNWKDYLNTIGKEEVERAKYDIEEWIGRDNVSGKTVLDVGSGSGVHSLAFFLLGARMLYSFDYDQHSVEATKRLWEREGKPENWVVSHGSILDKEYLKSFSNGYDIAYSWGVLHHTGAMWKALDNSINLVKPGGALFVSLYAKGPRYSQDLASKRRFNAASRVGKKRMIYKTIGRLMLSRLRRFQNPFLWNERRSRGMNVYHDIVDWLGGLPYEVASEDEVLSACRKRGLILERIKVKGEGACNIYVFSLPINSGNLPEPTR